MFTEISEQYKRTQQFFGESILQEIQQKRITIIGAGAFGNEMVKNLVMLGVQHIHLVDFDVVELSNLNRCVFFRPEHKGMPKVLAIKKEVESIFKNVQIIPHITTIDAAAKEVWDVPLIVVAVDNNFARWQINTSILTLNVPHFVINGAIARNFVEVQILQPSFTPCLCCLWSKTYFQKIISEYIKSQCNEFYQPTVLVHPVISVTTSLAGAIASTEAIKILAGYNHYQNTQQWLDGLKPLLGNYIRYHLQNHNCIVGKISRNAKCVEPLCCLPKEYAVGDINDN